MYIMPVSVDIINSYDTASYYHSKATASPKKGWISATTSSTSHSYAIKQQAIKISKENFILYEAQEQTLLKIWSLPEEDVWDELYKEMNV